MFYKTRHAVTEEDLSRITQEHSFLHSKEQEAIIQCFKTALAVNELRLSSKDCPRLIHQLASYLLLLDEHSDLYILAQQLRVQLDGGSRKAALLPRFLELCEAAIVQQNAVSSYALQVDFWPPRSSDVGGSLCDVGLQKSGSVELAGLAVVKCGHYCVFQSAGWFPELKNVLFSLKVTQTSPGAQFQPAWSASRLLHCYSVLRAVLPLQKIADAALQNVLEALCSQQSRGNAPEFLPLVFGFHPGAMMRYLGDRECFPGERLLWRAVAESQNETEELIAMQTAAFFRALAGWKNADGAEPTRKGQINSSPKYTAREFTASFRPPHARADPRPAPLEEAVLARLLADPALLLQKIPLDLPAEELRRDKAALIACFAYLAQHWTPDLLAPQTAFFYAALHPSRYISAPGEMSWDEIDAEEQAPENLAATEKPAENNIPYKAVQDCITYIQDCGNRLVAQLPRLQKFSSRVGRLEYDIVLLERNAARHVEAQESGPVRQFLQENPLHIIDDIVLLEPTQEEQTKVAQLLRNRAVLRPLITTDTAFNLPNTVETHWSNLKQAVLVNLANHHPPGCGIRQSALAYMAAQK